MKILLFYDNFVRDFRSLLILKCVLETLGNECYLEPLWKGAINEIRKINPDTVVQGQIGEYSTSRIGIFCHNNSINLVLNTSEFVTFHDKLYNTFSVNREYYNSEIIDLQTLPNKIYRDYVANNKRITSKHKYKLIGIPRMDLNINPIFRNLEVNNLRTRYGITKKNKVFLFMSSFIYDESGGQIDPHNRKSMDFNTLFHDEIKQKRIIKEILTKFSKRIDNTENILLIKRHPWDKTTYFEDNFKGKNIIAVDNTEYVSPLIAICNFLLHTHSTTAIEAWCQNKKTISILPFFDGNRHELRYHQRYEVIVRNYEELIRAVENYPGEIAKKSLEHFQPYLDGKVTIRLAQEINKLKPKKDKVIFMKPRNYNIVSTIKKINSLFHLPIRKTVNNKTIDKDTYGYLLRLYEKQRPFVEKLYEKPTKEYITENIQLIKSKGK